MRVETTRLAGLLRLVPTPHRDERGFFTRTFDDATAREAGIDPAAFVQDSQSRSHQGVVRGMHGRVGSGEAKLVRAAHGAVLDVVVDARPGSPTFGQAESVVLDDDTFVSLYIPRGFLHGHQTLTPTADVCYRIDAEHDPTEDVAVHHLDPDLAIAWPAEITTVSARDRAAGSWAQLTGRLSAS
ncbi:dTDP-4-dehydrorhamnose 3,5-epimerase [Isoptericola sp. CG 20/1183]|uniref:dTDP-4-dehydrorhamnose 3,5-epimerase n=1 Tax=Isoptericola halotolerans TaxID=300560 RepID=A0ABX5EDC4_9MICO|nr:MULTISPECIES: dTDP-4-dehydrorhamnose 3,5-epimerase [Isoptericola]PRZ06408.1 dTDP-4-dehydrorhamnose 3,5-epimerase [Isoptericola halotolerans]PRZ06786.1 dTDP-4-dehydrorhamnose 3,5-epimerase [Isoptericola sp. CG 20/1183]